MSRSTSTRVPTWETGVISGKKNNMQDLFDDQSIDWATFDSQSHDLDLSNAGHAKPDFLYWPAPQPDNNCASPLESPQEFGRGVPPLPFESRSTVPKPSCKQTGSNQPILGTSKPPTAQPREPEQQQQQQQKSRFPHSYSDSSGLTDLSSHPFLSYNHSISSAASSNSSTSTSYADHSISLCTQIISHLDSHLGDSTLGLDGVLRISKSGISGLLHVTSLESCQADPNCLLLLCVAVNQLSALFETNVPTATAKDDSLSAVPTALPSLLFGSFQVEHEDLLALGTRLVCREIQRCRQLLDRIRGIHHLQLRQRSRESDDAATSAAGLLQKQWFLALAGRLDGLVAAVTT